MFRHQGKKRTSKHNLQIAIVLSFVAGIVNVTGFLAINQLTTNVTGHFALFIHDVAHFKFWSGTIYLAYILSFLSGAFTSGLLIETFRESKKLNIYVWPTIIESSILITVVLITMALDSYNTHLIACMLLFSMGVQNSFVTKISNAVVRTTHLTGLFTDLGIELSQLLFLRTHSHVKKIKTTIQLRLFIISFFFFGGLVAGFFYSRVGLGLNTLFLAISILIISLLYDDFRYRLILLRRKLDQKKL